jgi:putative ABC transport system permease protein
VFNDLRFAVRVLSKSPGFTLIAVIALALGIGANTAIFTVVNSVLLKPLPYAQPERLAHLYCADARQGVFRIGFAHPDFEAMRDQNRSFLGAAAYWGDNVNLTGGDRPERVQGAYISVNGFDVLGVRPVLGRSFHPEDSEWGRNRVALLSDALWERRYGRARDIVGRKILLNSVPHVIIGVMPRGIDFPDKTTAVWMPISFRPGDDMATRMNHYMDAVGRLRPGVTLDQARADVAAIARNIEAQFKENAGIGMYAEDYTTSLVGDVRPALWILLGAVGFVLLIACANVANLMLARASARHREFTIRAALGAGHIRLMRQTLVESALLGAAGGASGIVLASWLLNVIRTISPPNIPRIDMLRMDPLVFVFTSALAMATVVLFGLFPAIDAGRADVAEALKESSRASGSRRRGRARNLLVIAEVTLSLVLVTGATLLIESLIKLQSVHPGFESKGLFTALVPLPTTRYEKPDQRLSFFDRALERIRALPGVTAAAAATTIPMGGAGGWGKWMTIEGREAARLQDVAVVDYREITPDYFRAMGVPLRSGRFFTASDGAGHPPVAIINESFARTYWPNESPIGRRIYVSPPAHLLPALKGQRIPRLTIVGVAGDMRQNGPGQPAKPELFVSYVQCGEEIATQMFIVARTSRDPLSLTAAVQGAVREIDPDQPVSGASSMEQRLSGSMARRRFNLFLLGAFAGLAVILAGVGIFGVMSYVVTQRTSEIGIRVALGAGSRSVLAMVMRYGLMLAGAGVLIGSLAALALTRVMSSLLYGIGARDPLAFALAPAFLLAISAVACYVPALQAVRLDPVRALRHE